MQQLKKLCTSKNYQKFDKKIKDKQFLLGKFYDATVTSLATSSCNKKHHNIKKFPKSKIKKLMQAQIKINKQFVHSVNANIIKQQKKQQIQQTKSDQILTYQFYIPLHNLWKRYMLDLVSKQQNQQSKQLKIIRADYHGALITIVGSKNQTLVGLSGLVVKQTLKTFQIITKNPQNTQQNKPKTILKSICIFLIQIGDQFSFVINGNSLVYRPSDRIRHKYKFKKADKLSHNFLQTIAQIGQEQEDLGNDCFYGNIL